MTVIKGKEEGKFVLLLLSTSSFRPDEGQDEDEEEKHEEWSDH